jgi:hypothetical protein
MKKALLILVVLAYATTFGCTPTKNDNGNTRNDNGKANNNDRLISTSEKEVRITITADPADPTKCIIAMPVPDPVVLKKDKDKIKWCIVYEGKVEGASVVLSDFKEKVYGSLRNPFGNNSGSENKFEIGPLKGGDRNCNITSKEATGPVGTTYKYTIQVVASGGKVVGELDPEVVISE